jgi:hypothetical protein
MYAIGIVVVNEKKVHLVLIEIKLTNVFQFMKYSVDIIKNIIIYVR